MRYVPGFDPGCRGTAKAKAKGKGAWIPDQVGDDRRKEGGGKGGIKKSPLRVEPQRGLR